jgi:hypothetical protein
MIDRTLAHPNAVDRSARGVLAPVFAPGLLVR